MSSGLEAFLPGPRRTLFLQACLLDRTRARAAWSEWLAGTDDPVRAFADPGEACLGLAPLLEGVATGPGSGKLGTAIAASVARGELRWRTLSRRAAAAVAAVASSGLAPLVSGGVAAALVAYGRPWRRHCHDVDLVVGGAERAAEAARALERAGFALDPGTGAHVDGSGTAVALHLSPFRSRLRRVSWTELERTATLLDLAGGHARGVAVGHLLSRASEGVFVHGRGGPLAWAADAAFLSRLLDEQGWSSVVDAAARDGAATPLAACLRFLAGGVGLRVPDGPLEALEDLACREGEAGVEACLALAPRRVDPGQATSRAQSP